MNRDYEIIKLKEKIRAYCREKKFENMPKVFPYQIKSLSDNAMEEIDMLFGNQIRELGFNLNHVAKTGKYIDMEGNNQDHYLIEFWENKK